MAMEPAAEARPPTVTAGRLLGLDDADLEEMKEQAVSVLQPGRSAKRRKLTHGLFFEEEGGLKKILDTFPKIRFQGKDEFQDLRILLQNYQRWLTDLAPWEAQANFEDAVWKTRDLFQAKERSPDGVLSDARERLHMLRFEYKTSGGGGTKAAAAAAAAKAVASPARPPVSKELSEEVRRKIEENKKRALELRRARDAAAGAAPPAAAAAGSGLASASSAGAPAGAAQATTPAAGVPAEAAPAASQGGAAAASPGTTSGAAPAASVPAVPPPAPPPAQAPAGPAYPMDPMEEWEDEDVFGFGGGLDDE